MSVTRCYLCEEDPLFQRRVGQSGFVEGSDCPICFQPVCRYHLTTVRWYWRDTSEVDTALICKECKRTYQHRTWDSLHRNWIT